MTSVRKCSPDDTSSLTNRFLHGPAVDQVFADENALGEVLWALPDNQGTVRDWVEYDQGTNTTSVVNHLKFDAFGQITAVEDGAGNPSTLDPQLSTFLYAYTGRAWDPDAELYYYRARWYDPAVGRFLSEDPLGFAAGDANLSRYVGNSPTNFIDPSGLEALTDATSAAPPLNPVDYPEAFALVAAMNQAASETSSGSGWWGGWHIPDPFDSVRGLYQDIGLFQAPPPQAAPPPGLPFGVPGYIDINIGSEAGVGVQIGAGPPGPIPRIPSVHPYFGGQTPGAALTWSPEPITPGLNIGRSYYLPIPIEDVPVPVGGQLGYAIPIGPGVPPGPGGFFWEIGIGTPGPGAGGWWVF